METKFKLQLGAVDNLEELKSIVTNAITFEVLVDMISEVIRRYQLETNLENFTNEFSQIAEDGRNVSFSNFDEWIRNRTINFQKLLSSVITLDEILAENGKIASGKIVEEIQTQIMAFLLTFNSVSITENELDLGKVEVKENLVNSALEQLALVNEGKILSTFISSSIEFTPLDVSKYKNSIVEKKLNHLDTIVKRCTSLYDNDSEKLINLVLHLYDKFYDVAYDSLTDGEKVEKARKLIKTINPHRQLLDKIENKLTEAHELRRQLTIHKQRILDNKENEENISKEKLAEDPSKEEIIGLDMHSLHYVTNEYINHIDNSGKNLDELKEKISIHYNTLDKLENAFKSAIPSEEEMMKFSSISFKLQELIVKLENAKSQVSKDNSEELTLIKTAISGLSTMLAYATDIKDLFMRNSMMTASFKAVNSLYDFTNGIQENTQLHQVKVMTNYLSKYSQVYSEFSTKLSEYKQLGNNTIRDISIIMGKAINGVNLLEILNILEERIKVLDKLNSTLVDNNERQNEILNEIMNI